MCVRRSWKGVEGVEGGDCGRWREMVGDCGRLREIPEDGAAAIEAVDHPDCGTREGHVCGSAVLS